MLSICDVFMDQCNCINWKFSTENGSEMFTSGLDRKLIIFIELGGNLFNDLGRSFFQRHHGKKSTIYFYCTP